MKTLYLCCLLSFIALSICFSIDSTKNYIIDEDGRYKLFHGVNVVVKLPPYIPDTEVFDPYTSFTDEDIEILKKLGINLVRLGIIWESIEREEGIYDLDHLEKMSDIVTKLEKNGIAVIIDAHQDMFSRTFCGEGTPKFYVDKLTVEKECKSNIVSQFFKLINVCIPLSKYGWEYDENGLPKIEDCKSKGTFIDYHKSPELMTIYDSFFNNENGVLDAFINFWKQLAQEFKGRKNVIGYDIWNEPWPANLWIDLLTMIPGKFDDERLTEFYKTVDEGIKKVDPHYTMLFEPIPFPDILPLFGGHALSTFSKAPVDVDERPSMFNIHSYCCAADQNICATGEPTLDDSTKTCPSFHERKIKKNKEQAQDIQVPLIITEFGACGASLACYNEMLGLEKAADNYMTSWVYWMYKPFNDHTTTASENEEGIFNNNGTIQYNKERALTRTYVQSFQGYPLTMEFNDDTKVFTSSFKYDPSIIEPSVIYANKKLNYVNGFLFEVTDSKGNKIENVDVKIKDDNYIYFKIISETEFEVKVTLNPK